MKHKSIAPLLIAVSIAAAPGCKSGWKMPSPSSMWPWNRTPSAETLAGTPAKPTTESPAAKHTPSAVNSVAAGTTKSATTGSATASTTGYPSASLASQVKPTYGGAAAANGYQIGPYGMGGQTAQAGQAASATHTGSPSTGYPGGAQLPPNTYAGTQSLPSSNLPPAGTPNTSANPYAPAVSPGTIASTPSPGPALPGGSSPYSMPNAAPQMSTSMPQYQPNVPPQASGVGSTVAFPTTPYSGSAGTAQLPPSSYGQAPAVTMPPLPGGASPGVTVPTSPVPPAGGDQYRPGSTGRVGNPYNFSTGNATVPVNSGSYAPSQPSAPGANSGYGSFQLPPNTANAAGQTTVR